MYSPNSPRQDCSLTKNTLPVGFIQRGYLIPDAAGVPFAAPGRTDIEPVEVAGYRPAMSFLPGSATPPLGLLKFFLIVSRWTHYSIK
jgi:hypothetical protein